MNPHLVNFPPCLIFDENFKENYPFGSVEPGRPFPHGMVESADSLSDLATKLGINGEELTRTVERFNGFARKGVDEDYRRELCQGPTDSPGITHTNPIRIWEQLRGLPSMDSS